MNMTRLYITLALIVTAFCQSYAQKIVTDTFTTRNGNEIVITPVKHGSLRITFGNREFEIDPVGPMAPKTDYSKLPKADYIIVTHEHYDHLDTVAIRQLSKNGTRIIANPNSIKIIGRGEAMKNGESMTLEKGIDIEAVAAHNHAAKSKFHPAGRDNGYILTIDEVRIYIAGDTEDIDEMKSIRNIDIAFLPCNLPYTMTPEQVAKVARQIKPAILFPYHYSDTKIERVTTLLKGTGIDVRIRNYQ